MSLRVDGSDRERSFLRSYTLRKSSPERRQGVRLRNALQMCGMICRLIREKTRLVLVISRSGKLQRVLDACGIAKADFDEVEKGLLKL